MAKPLIHFITNHVTMSDVAQMSVNVGCSPIMVNDIRSLKELSHMTDVLVVNLGTMDKARVKLISKAVKYAKQNRVPVLLDPVGAGAISRRAAYGIKLLKRGHMALIKCNVSEALSLLYKTSKGIGVDSEIIRGCECESLARELASTYKTFVVITGEKDYISDGKEVLIADGGSDYLKSVVGSGCMLNAVLAPIYSEKGHQLMQIYYRVKWYKNIAKEAADIVDQSSALDYKSVFMTLCRRPYEKDLSNNGRKS